MLENAKRGREFEKAAKAALQAGKTRKVTGETLDGTLRNTIPDSFVDGMTEIKDVIELSYGVQLQAQIWFARNVLKKPYNLVVSPRTTSISGKSSGG